MKIAKYIETLDYNELKDNFSKLTDRQKEILNLLSYGLTRKEIADILCISINTVVTHINFLYYNLGVNNAHGAVGLWMIYKELKGDVEHVGTV